MVTYIAVPARMIGAPGGGKAGSRRDRFSVSAIGAGLGLFVGAPPYLLGRIGLLMLGSPVFFVPGLLVFAAGAVLQAGATGAVKAIKVSARLTAGRGLPRRIGIEADVCRSAGWGSCKGPHGSQPSRELKGGKEYGAQPRQEPLGLEETWSEE